MAKVEPLNTLNTNKKPYLEAEVINKVWPAIDSLFFLALKGNLRKNGGILQMMHKWKPLFSPHRPYF